MEEKGRRKKCGNTNEIHTGSLLNKGGDQRGTVSIMDL
jgi:hypothetical protein